MRKEGQISILEDVSKSMVQFKGELCCMKDNVKDMERSRNVEKNGEKEQGGRRSGKRKDKEQTRKKERAWKNIHVNFL